MHRYHAASPSVAACTQFAACISSHGISPSGFVFCSLHALATIICRLHAFATMNLKAAPRIGCHSHENPPVQIFERKPHTQLSLPNPLSHIHDDRRAHGSGTWQIATLTHDGLQMGRALFIALKALYCPLVPSLPCFVGFMPSLP